MPSLREIEETVSTLWLNEEARTWLVKRRGPRPACLKGAAAEILDSVDRQGVELYAELLNFGHHDVMASIYPYCRKLLGKQWAGAVDDYLAKFPPDHFNFNRLCSRFSQYLTIYGGTLTERWLFLTELADYEWIELEKLEQDALIESVPHQALTNLNQVMSLKPVLNPTVSIRNYHYNVLEIADKLEHGKRLLKILPERTLVAIYRHPQTHTCKYIELGETAAKVVEESQGQLSYQQLITIALTLMPDSNPQTATLELLELVEELQELGIFVGSVPV